LRNLNKKSRATFDNLAPSRSLVIKKMQDRVRPYAEKTIDLTGLFCPMTFVYTKIALEEMEQGQVLEVTLDYPPAFTNVVRSVKFQHLGIVIHEAMDGGVKKIWIKRS
jgi:tRNA 2-thiouridine synthesizing protein A